MKTKESNRPYSIEGDRIVVAEKAEWELAVQLLKVRQYDQVIQMLHKFEAAAERKGDNIQATILGVIGLICLICQQHNSAIEQAVLQEKTLQRELRQILEWLSIYATVQQGQARISANGPLDMQTPIGKSSSPLSIWQRLQNLLRWNAQVEPETDSDFNQTTFLANTPLHEITNLPSMPAAGKGANDRPPHLAVYCLGAFRLFLDNKEIKELPSGKAKTIFKYLIAHHNKPVLREILMHLFWPEADFEAARNNLNVSIYGLRQAFRVVRPEFNHLLYEEERYFFNPEMTIWLDFEEFLHHFDQSKRLEDRGHLARAIRGYEKAVELYQGDFLEGDLYEDWLILKKEGLIDAYLIILERLSHYYLQQKRYSKCIDLCHQMLQKDSCREDAHRRLMRCYIEKGQRNLAIRQYQLCQEAVHDILDVSPMPETEDLYQKICRQ